ncbi:MAG: hypothetical protein JXB49_37130 [Bacteroidales bacterium]|nr:hypothetical protein [Bacteroidales bacterium]
MKTFIQQSIVSNSQRFLNNIYKELPEGVKSFSITSFKMQRASGYGSYNYIMDVVINGKNVTFKRFSHDSIDFDYYTDLEYMSHNFNNWVKSKVLSMLSTDFIYNEIFEISNTNE